MNSIVSSQWLADNAAELVAFRRDLHAHPELGMEEHRTSAAVAEKLASRGVTIETGIGRFGVVGVIEGKRPGVRKIGLRADMDALPIIEETGLPYASTRPGLMHACGHDGHTTMLMGAAWYLQENRDFAGTVHLIFQPAEEGRGGAKAMIEDGLFDRFPCDAIYGLHNTAGMPVGKFGIRVGPMMSASDSWQVEFSGPGGHGGVAPHLSNDITHAAAHFILGLQGIVGRNVPPAEPAVLSIGYISAGDPLSGSVIPSKLVIRGTSRSFSASTRETLARRLEEVARLTAETWRCTAETSYRRGNPALVNAPEATGKAVSAAIATTGADNVNAELAQTTGAEDFAVMLQLRPGAYMRIGNGSAPDGTFHGTHTPRYDFNDEIISTGINYWVNIVDAELGTTAPRTL